MFPASAFPQQSFNPSMMPDGQPHGIPNFMQGGFPPPPAMNSNMGIPNYGMPGAPAFYENLVGKINPVELKTLVSEVKSGVINDISSRSEWDSRNAAGLKQMGLFTENKGTDNTAAGGLYSSAFMQSLLTFLAQISSVILPARGPAHMKFINQIKDKSYLKFVSERSITVEAFMNNLLTDFSPEFYMESEQCFLWSSFYGSCFKKPYFDESMSMPVSPMIMPTDLIVNNNAISIMKAPRITHRFFLTQKELKMRKLSGMYADVDPAAFRNDDMTLFNQVMQSIKGIDSQNSYGQKSTENFEIMESRVDYPIQSIQDNPTIPCPYILTFEKNSEVPFGLYRNWRIDDPYFLRINDLIHYQLFPFDGLLGIGYVQLMGNNAAAATELLRQLIFSSKINNMPAWIRRKGMRMDNSTIDVSPGKSFEVDTGNLSIQDCFMRIPTADPSPMFKELKDDLEKNGVFATANSLNTVLTDMSPTAPVGTTFALLDQASKVETSVIRRFHRSMTEELNVIYRLVKQNFPKIQAGLLNKGITLDVFPQDFQLNLQITPVSDPNVSTSSHLLIQAQALTELYQQFPQLINPRQIVEAKLRALKIVDMDDFLVPEPENVMPLNPAEENINMMLGKPAKASLEQNHPAHITSHSGLKANPQIANNPTLMAVVDAHIQEHIAMDYQMEMQQQMQAPIPTDGSDSQDMNMQNQIAQQAAQATNALVQKYQSMMNANQPPQTDPNLVLLTDIQSKKAALDNRTQVEFIKTELGKYKADQEYEEKQRALDIKEKEIDLKYNLHHKEQEYDRLLQEQDQRMNQVREDNEMIRFHLSQMNNHFDNLTQQDNQQSQQMHEVNQQMMDHNFQAAQQQAQSQQQFSNNS